MESQEKTIEDRVNKLEEVIGYNIQSIGLIYKALVILLGSCGLLAFISITTLIKLVSISQ